MYKNVKSFVNLCSILVLLGCLLFSCQSSETPDSDQAKVTTQDSTGFVSMFDGKTLSGWEGDTAVWHVEDGAIIGQITAASTPLKANSFLIWKGGTPSDFELTGEYEISP